MRKKPTIAFMYDFDKTLCTTDMQNYGFMSDLGMEPKDFWAACGVETEKYGNCFPVCVHHDNFFRTIIGDQWKIGTNGSASFPMDYTSPRPDYATVDDGFRITLNYLTNDTSVTVARGIRLIDNVRIKEL